ncbi:MAG: hypothetical protein LUF33_03645 [Clostridiales bacterium]|nr:hypothetical protein [Clostridiales bacterium]
MKVCYLHQLKGNIPRGILPFNFINKQKVTGLEGKLQRERLAYEAVGDTDRATAINIRINRLKQKYKEFSKAAGLRERTQRMNVDFDNNNSVKPVANSDESGIINTGATSGALNPYSKAANEHAEKYYESVRHMTNDTKKISEATAISQDKIDKIKNHVFVKEHDLIGGHPRFTPSYDMAQSWQRLISGNFEEKDIILLKHEYAELRYMEKGLSQNEAHIKASNRYNYAKYCD